MTSVTGLIHLWYGLATVPYVRTAPLYRLMRLPLFPHLMDGPSIYTYIA